MTSEPAVVNETALQVVEVEILVGEVEGVGKIVGEKVEEVVGEVGEVVGEVAGGCKIVEIQSKYDLTRVKPLG